VGFVSKLPDYYESLNLPRDASAEDIRRAFREAALKLHPDRNTELGDTERFLNISEAYETLIDEELRKHYDAQLQMDEEAQIQRASFSCHVEYSRKSLLQIGEPQVQYLILNLYPIVHERKERPPINLAIVIDRSTSMRGQRLDRVRSAALAILQNLAPEDAASIIAFSDRAELIVSPKQAQELSTSRARLSLLQAGGGTEIGQGLSMGMKQLQESFLQDGVNHLVLLTDGRTYGDEDLCLEISDRAASRGIAINTIGIGSDWSDRLVDEMATRTGGSVAFLDTPRSIGDFLQDIFDKLGKVYASRMRLGGSLAQQVDLRSAFRLLPEPMPLMDRLPIVLGNLDRDQHIQLLLELVVHPIGNMNELTLAHFSISGNVVGLGSEQHALPLHITMPVSNRPDPDPPPEAIFSALSFITLYRMQEKARHEAELGQVGQAAKRLENLATHLLAAGQRELAKSALNEAARVIHTRHISASGEKELKYGTRNMLMLPAKRMK